MSEQDNKISPVIAQGDSMALAIPAFRNLPALSLDLSKTRESESRFIEAKTVNPITYADLEHTFNESYRELKRHHTTLGYRKVQVQRQIDLIKAEIVINKYPEFMKDRPKSQDNADLRNAFLMKDPEYIEALELFDRLNATESFVENRIKVIENVTRYMRKQMDMIIRSGLTDRNLYVTSGGKY